MRRSESPTRGKRAAGAACALVVALMVVASLVSAQPQTITRAGSSAFSAITQATNTTATMTVGSGSVLTYSGSGRVDASHVFHRGIQGFSGGTGTLGTTSGTLTSGNCAGFDAAGNIIDAGACGGAPAFSAITSATNTTATMSVGTGARLEPTGTGTIHANEIVGRKPTGFTGPGMILTVTSSTPASNVVPKFGSDGNLTSSILQDDGTTVSVNGTAVGQLQLRDLGSTYGTFLAPNSLTAARTYRLPDATGTLAVIGNSATGSPANGQVLIGNANTPAFDMAALGVSGGLVIATSAGGLNIQMSTPRMCDMVIGTEDGSALTTANLAPQRFFCTIPATATLVEFRLDGDGGTPRVMPQKRSVGPAASSTNLLANGLTGAGTSVRCTRAATGVGVDMRTNCGNTLSVTSLSPGDTIGFGAPMTAASGVEKLVRGTIYYTVP